MGGSQESVLLALGCLDLGFILLGLGPRMTLTLGCRRLAQVGDELFTRGLLVSLN